MKINVKRGVWHMKIGILDVGTLGDDLNLESIENLGDVTTHQLTYAEDVIDRIKDKEVLILNKVKLNESNLKYAKNLKLICITATGFDNVDTEYCKEQGIAVCNVAGYSTDSVVQVTVSMALALSTNLMQYNQYVKSNQYTKSGIFNCLKPVFHEISGKTWGIVGLGNIGRKVAAAAEAMGCNVIAYKRTPTQDYECVGIDELCSRADIITLHTPLNEQTKGLINKERIVLMKKDAILINAARGAVVDEEAVAVALENNEIGGFGSDVYSIEPMQENSPYQRILKCENTIFTPHMAWGAYEARQRCVDEVSENIKSFYEGKMRNRIV